MGNYRSGRRPVPTALHIARGTLQSRHLHQRAGEPKAERGLPPIPADVAADALALAHWQRLAEQLTRAFVLTRDHGDALALLAQVCADYERIRDNLQATKHQQLVVDEVRDKAGQLLRRRVRENPLIRRSERLALLKTRLLAEFGLTPITATKVHAADGPPTRASRYISGA